MIKTSYFNSRKLKNIHFDDIFSIALYQPLGFKFNQYLQLAPKRWFLEKYKKDNDCQFFIDHYYNEVLDNLNPEQVYEDIGPSGVMVCWEGSDKFCHRHIVAEWLENQLGIKVKEL